jgi:hypothetical protein
MRFRYSLVSLIYIKGDVEGGAYWAVNTNVVDPVII